MSGKSSIQAILTETRRCLLRPCFERLPQRRAEEHPEFTQLLENQSAGNAAKALKALEIKENQEAREA